MKCPPFQVFLQLNCLYGDHFTALTEIQYIKSILLKTLKSILHLYLKYTLSILIKSILKVLNYWALKRYT